MLKPAFGPAVLFALVVALVGVSPALYAQSVSLNVCNAGKVDIDVFLSQLGKVSSSHIGPADCTTVAGTTGSMAPAYVGFAFTDSKGQWGSARRLELLPDLGLDILDRANQDVSVRHGNVSVSMPMLMLFKPRSPICTTTTSSPSAVARLPLSATPAQVSAARAQDMAAPPSSSSTSCETLGYTLNALTYPDSREVRFNRFCDPCDKKREASLTPEERAAEQRRLALINREVQHLEMTGPIGALVIGGYANRAKQLQQEEEQQRARELRQDQFQRVGWSDMSEFIYRAFRNPGVDNKNIAIQNIVIQGTIASIKLPLPGASELWTDIYFKESPDKKFNMCTSSPDIFQDVFGPNFSTSMIGKTVEVAGELTRVCQSGAGIRVTLARQLHLVGSGPGMVAAAVAPAITFPNLAPTPVPKPYFDPGMPNYQPRASAEILQYCTGIYDPVYPLLTPEQIRIKNANHAAIQAEVEKCASGLTLPKVRRIAESRCVIVWASMTIPSPEKATARPTTTACIRTTP
jgi:hypothetical protein